MGKMWIRQVKAIRNDGNASTIDLQQGLNCIIGPSNTGKTGIAKTISFVCGGNAIPSRMSPDMQEHPSPSVPNTEK